MPRQKLKVVDIQELGGDVDDGSHIVFLALAIMQGKGRSWPGSRVVRKSGFERSV